MSRLLFNWSQLPENRRYNVLTFVKTTCIELAVTRKVQPLDSFPFNSVFVSSRLKQNHCAVQKVCTYVGILTGKAWSNLNPYKWALLVLKWRALDMRCICFIFLLRPSSLRARAKSLTRLAFVTALANNTNKHSRHVCNMTLSFMSSGRNFCHFCLRFRYPTSTLAEDATITLSCTISYFNVTNVCRS